MAARTEFPRQSVHVGVGALALLLRWLTWPQAALAALIAVAGNTLLLPRVAPGLFRPGDLERPIRSGIVLYPLAVLGLVLAFRERLDIVAIAWVVLAAGDGFATLVGAHVASARLPWNGEKSVAGLLAFWGFAGAAGLGIAWWMRDVSPAPAWWLIAAPVTAAAVAGLVETAPIRLDDNVSVAATAGLVLGSLTIVDAATLAGAADTLAARLPPAVLANALVAWAGWRAGTVTPAGAVTGFLIGVAIVAGGGWPAWTLLLVCFAAAVVATRAGYARKARLGIAEARGGRRGPGNAIANTGAAAWAALLVPGAANPQALLIALTAALVTGASDTIASEVGKAWGRTTYLVTTFRRVPPGTSGAVSVEGTIAGIAAAAALAGAATALGLMPAAAIVVVTVAATVASLVEGVLGATLEHRGILDNDALNVVNTALGAGLALVLWRTV
ncbi:MAG: DUF92 domain-containing protein [Vicinamibacterales bacterium]